MYELVGEEHQKTMLSSSLYYRKATRGCMRQPYFLINVSWRREGFHVDPDTLRCLATDWVEVRLDEY